MLTIAMLERNKLFQSITSRWKPLYFK